MYTEEVCWEQLRASRDDIPQLASELGFLPPVIMSLKKYRFTRVETVVCGPSFRYVCLFAQWLGELCRKSFLVDAHE